MSYTNRLLLTLCGGTVSALMVPAVYLLLSSDYELTADNISSTRFLMIVLAGIIGCIISLAVTTLSKKYFGITHTGILGLTAVAISFALITGLLIVAGFLGVSLATYNFEVRNLLTMIPLSGLLFVYQDRLVGK